MERCPWGQTAVSMNYHDTEWGRPCHDDAKLFEMLVLEGMQAGLSWECILKKREAMRVAFDDFDVRKVAAYDDAKVAELMEAPGVIHNGRKLASLSVNAQAFLRVQEEFGSFNAYFWGFVGNEPLVNTWQTQDQMPATTPLAESISKDMKKRGFKFCGPTIIYSLMQSVGLVDDHLVSCPSHTFNR